jgi:hypothetical protein
LPRLWDIFVGVVGFLWRRDRNEAEMRRGAEG